MQILFAALIGLGMLQTVIFFWRFHEKRRDLDADPTTAPGTHKRPARFLPKDRTGPESSASRDHFRRITISCVPEQSCSVRVSTEENPAAFAAISISPQRTAISIPWNQ